MLKTSIIFGPARRRLAGTCRLLVLFLTILLTSCEDEFFPGLEWPHYDIVVTPGSSIQAAVDKAEPGDVIFIKSGTYKEAILVDKPDITIKGSENVVIVNPANEEDGIRVTQNGDGFKLYYVTLRDFEENGVFMIRADNYVLSHVTTINCGEYGLFPIASNHGLIEYCIASGHTDTGIYVGQCEDSELYHNTVYGNVNGLEIENCSKVIARYNNCYDNVAGILVVLLPGLRVTTSSDILISDNEITDNNHENFSEPNGGFENFVPSGCGILIVGTDNTRVEKNNVSGNDFLGIAVTSTLLLGGLAGLPPEDFSSIEPNPDGARVINNEVKNNGTAPPELPIPVPGVDLFWDGSGTDNCWRDNTYATTYPETLPTCTN
ncbi:right-handed parallel beta-helix repeat-containing protein [Pontibacter sp. 172403-2]|uniref:parallel beta-helix domain-containing protein n=1 Tax=Pontibacter rufus TaxID=2791028 RepID=UPI0018AFF573|nr:parallel beta-helix domain-containing protein [Pontibacter sp. 172403-2]MBF9254342.1 right-handed parallel beta-helix repeat-containing protein [Pontibacter sp. 172403-2]